MILINKKHYGILDICAIETQIEENTNFARFCIHLHPVQPILQGTIYLKLISWRTVQRQPYSMWLEEEDTTK